MAPRHVMQMLRCRLLILPLGLSAMACGGGGGVAGGDSWTAAVDTLGDTIIVRTVAGSVWGDTATLVPEIGIGMLDGPDEYLLGNVRSIAVSSAGEIYLMDRQVPALRKYASDGTFLLTLGREGGGPGEYKRPDGGLGVLPDGRVVLRDPGNARVNVYSPAGEDITSWRVAGGFNTSRRMYLDGAGNSYNMVLLERGLAPWDWTYGLARYTPDGEHADTVIAPTWDYEAPQLTASREGSNSSTSVPFSPTKEWSFSPLGYMVGGVSTDYTITLYRVDQPILQIKKEFTPVAVLPEEAEERERRQVANWRRQYPGWRWNGPPIPETKPPFREVYVGDDGRIWVQLSQTGRPTMTVEEAREEERRTSRPPLRYSEPVAFDVFDPEGRFLGLVITPDEFRTSPQPVFRGDYVWAVTRDELDVITVVRFRLTLPSET